MTDTMEEVKEGVQIAQVAVPLFQELLNMIMEVFKQHPVENHANVANQIKTAIQNIPAVNLSAPDPLGLGQDGATPVQPPTPTQV